MYYDKQNKCFLKRLRVREKREREGGGVGFCIMSNTLVFFIFTIV